MRLMGWLPEATTPPSHLGHPAPSIAQVFTTLLLPQPAHFPDTQNARGSLVLFHEVAEGSPPGYRRVDIHLSLLHAEAQTYQNQELSALPGDRLSSKSTVNYRVENAEFFSPLLNM
jgi:hypothetical protein